MTALALAGELLVPGLFALGIGSVFGWNRTAWLVWGVAAVAAILGWVPAIRTAAIAAAIVPAILPALHLIWYHALRRIAYGSWHAQPAFIMFNYRKDAGSQRDRWFGVTFMLTALAASLILSRSA